jgi:hypothetical protein
VRLDRGRVRPEQVDAGVEPGRVGQRDVAFGRPAEAGGLQVEVGQGGVARQEQRGGARLGQVGGPAAGAVVEDDHLGAVPHPAHGVARAVHRRQLAEAGHLGEHGLELVVALGVGEAELGGAPRQAVRALAL